MTRNDIIRMAREANIGTYINLESHLVGNHLERFAALVAAAEREESAKLLEEMAAEDNLTNRYQVAALAIRARGKA